MGFGTVRAVVGWYFLGDRVTIDHPSAQYILLYIIYTHTNTHSQPVPLHHDPARHHHRLAHLLLHRGFLGSPLQLLIAALVVFLGGGGGVLFIYI